MRVSRRQNVALRAVRRFDLDAGWYRLGWFDTVVAVGLGRDPAVHLFRVAGPGRAAPGALDVPGFSDFMAADGHLMIAIGDGPDAGGGVRVSTYDITEPAAPRRTASFAFAAPSTSEGDGDATHFEYLPAQHQLLVPAYVPVGTRWYEALLTVHLAADGTLSSTGRRLVRATSHQALARGGVSFDYLALPDGRVALLRNSGVTLMSPGDLTVLGSVEYRPPGTAARKGL
jgi:hypothetical protein